MIRFCIFLVAALCVLCCGAAAIDAALGEVIPLEGYCPTSNNVYLFLTGPNLPVNGVQLNDISKRADEGHFTVVPVDGNDHWNYKWGTCCLGGRLDAGTYTVWIVNGPNDRSRLAQADYRTISVNLGKPSLSVDTPAPTGSMDITSIPSGAAVMVGPDYKGRTPVSVGNLAPGTYNVSFSLTGYYGLTTPVRIEEGSVSEVTANMVRMTPAPQVTGSVPAPVASGTQEVPAPAPTRKAATILPVIAGALTLAGVMRCRRNQNTDPRI